MPRLRAFLIFPVLIFASCETKKESAPEDEDVTPRSRSVRSEREPRGRAGSSKSLGDDFAKARTRPTGEERQKEIAEIAWEALESAPEVAAQAILELTPGTPEKKSLIEAYIRRLLKEDKTEEAMAWAESLGNEEDIQSAISKINELAVIMNPEKDALELSESNFSGEVDPQAVEVIQNWVDKNPVHAADWVSRMPEGEGRSKGFEILLGAWALKDPKEAFSWISNQGTPQLKEEGLNGVIAFLSGQPGPIRDNVLEQVDPNLRKEVQQRIDQQTTREGDDEGKAQKEELRPEESSVSPDQPEEKSADDEGGE